MVVLGGLMLVAILCPSLGRQIYLLIYSYGQRKQRPEKERKKTKAEQEKITDQTFRLRKVFSIYVAVIK